ncbi:MAG: hypothetical protein HDR26_09830 [Lachnospiraceae bacterium]|nr:hypothetical protein [Lachnospiraceae bacterium]
MKKVRKLVVSLLALVMVLSMCGCGGKSGGDVVGTWSLEYDLSNALAGEMGEEYADFNSTLMMKMMFEFNEDGTFRIYTEEDSFVANFEKWVEEFVAFSVDSMYDSLKEESGLEKEDADAMFEQVYGMGIEAFLREYIASELDAKSLAQEMSTSGKYETSGDKLYMAEGSESIDKNSYDVFTVNGDVMKLELPAGAANEEIVPGLSYPIELKKEK